MKMKLKEIVLIVVAALVCFACENTTYVPETETEPQGETVRFLSVAKAPNTRADNPSPLTQDDLHIIAPGYGTGASDQHAIYESNNGAMTPKTGEDEIRWSAKNMFFTSWHPVDGVTVKEDGTGTVDFTKSALEDFIGAHAKDVAYQKSPQPVPLEYSHLVAKFKMTLKNEAALISESASITLPAIKQTGIFKADLTGMPEVSLGKAGDALKFDFVVNAGQGTCTCYMPPMTGTQLLMYGSFTIKIGSSTYVGTLNNLGVKEIKAGDHLTFTIVVNDDHTALLQAVTLAPWEVNSKNIYNRPSKGIWGLEDLQALSKLVNGEGVPNEKGDPEWNNLTIDSLVNDKGVINLYTNIEFEKDDEFAPIGTAGHPFAGYIFEGNGYTISNVVPKKTDKDNLGLFGVVGGDSDATTIRNLTVKGALAEGETNIGILVGKTTGSSPVTIDHCFTSGGEVMGEENVGGLIGHCAANTLIRNCGVATSSISGNKNVGGFVGLNDGLIGNSYSNTGALICDGLMNEPESGYGGGFVGRNQNIIRNTYSCATFSYGTSKCGAAAGYHQPGKEMTHCYWNTECVNNTSCSKVVGNSEENKDGIEQKPSGFSGGLAFNKGNGQIINSGYIPLYDRLNNYIIENPTKTDQFLRWAKIAGNNNDLPVFGY